MIGDTDLDPGHVDVWRIDLDAADYADRALLHPTNSAGPSVSGFPGTAGAT